MHLKFDSKVLNAEPYFWKFEYDKKLENYNGTGPEWFPESLRAKLDDILKIFAEAVAIHDDDYTRLDKSEKSKKKADKRFFKNCKALAWKRSTWWKYFFVWKPVARVLYLTLKEHGDGAFYGKR